MKKTILLLMIPMMGFSQDTIESKSIMDAFGAIDKILELTMPSATDPVRVSKAKIVNSRATRKSLKEIKRLNKAYEKGDIDFSTYVTLKAAELGRSIEELISEEMLIKSKATILKNEP